MNNSVHDKSWQSFLNLCRQLESTEELDQMLRFFLTVEELQALAGRYRIIKALLKGQDSQRKMAEALQVSIAKITRGSNGLKQQPDEFKQRLTALMEQHNQSTDQ